MSENASDRLLANLPISHFTYLRSRPGPSHPRLRPTTLRFMLVNKLLRADENSEFCRFVPFPTSLTYNTIDRHPWLEPITLVNISCQQVTYINSRCLSWLRTYSFTPGTLANNLSSWTEGVLGSQYIQGKTA